ncbi:hypothetical protein BC628DRAFT_621725 [Trametes gibbosa]|nr:hypothetical protein BC628DRAFT_621725 [Trametes gibbosa]
MFRLPTHLETLVPPPTEQVPQSQPWRGRFALPASSPHLSARPREIWITAAETENDNSQQELWPKDFHLQIIRRGGILRELHAWLAQLQPAALSRSMLMPDRLADPAKSKENETMFESLARQLLEEGIVSCAVLRSWSLFCVLHTAAHHSAHCPRMLQVAIAPWSLIEPSHPGGLILYPTSTTRALLVAVVCLNVGFPEFIIGPGPSSHTSPIAGPSRVPLGPPLLPRVQSFPAGLDTTLPNISSTARYPQSGRDPAARGGASRTGRHSG